jgi:hypothetical protein
MEETGFQEYGQKVHHRSASASQRRDLGHPLNQSGIKLDFNKQKEELFKRNNQVEISTEDFQLFGRLKKIIDACVKMQCSGCHKLIPTVQFWEHLLDQESD